MLWLLILWNQGGAVQTDSNSSAQPAQQAGPAGWTRCTRVGLPREFLVVVVFVWGLVVVFLLVMDCDLHFSVSSEMFTGLSPFLHK